MIRSTSSVRAVSITTYASLNDRIRRHTSIPSIPGSIRSSTITSGRKLRASSTPRSPSSATSTSKPSASR